jgi:hypothetical protein
MLFYLAFQLQWLCGVTTVTTRHSTQGTDVMDDKQTQVATIAQNIERDILDRIVNAMLAAEKELCGASVQEWDRVLTDSCRQQKQADRESLATIC